MHKKNSKVDLFLSKAKQWREELTKLRSIVLECGLTEELKWYQPCYTFQNANVLILSGFKGHCVLSFFKGALLHDDHKILHRPGANSQAVRTVRFTGVDQIVAMEPILKAYIYEAMQVEKAGLKVDFKEKLQLEFPEEFQRQLKASPALKAAFEKLTPGRQRAYNLHFSAPKQSSTRESRIEKCLPRILAGKGLTD